MTPRTAALPFSGVATNGSVGAKPLHCRPQVRRSAGPQVTPLPNPRGHVILCPVAVRRAKIVCTLGPSCDEQSVLEQLIRAGMDVARLNFSHGSHEEHTRRYATV